MRPWLNGMLLQRLGPTGQPEWSGSGGHFICPLARELCGQRRDRVPRPDSPSRATSVSPWRTIAGPRLRPRAPAPADFAPGRRPSWRLFGRISAARLGCARERPAPRVLVRAALDTRSADAGPWRAPSLLDLRRLLEAEPRQSGARSARAGSRTAKCRTRHHESLRRARSTSSRSSDGSSGPSRDGVRSGGGRRARGAAASADAGRRRGRQRRVGCSYGRGADAAVEAGPGRVSACRPQSSERRVGTSQNPICAAISPRRPRAIDDRELVGRTTPPCTSSDDLRILGPVVEATVSSAGAIRLLPARPGHGSLG